MTAEQQAAATIRYAASAVMQTASRAVNACRNRPHTTEELRALEADLQVATMGYRIACERDEALRPNKYDTITQSQIDAENCHAPGYDRGW